MDWVARNIQAAPIAISQQEDGTHQKHLPEQEQDLLHGEVWSMTAAELGHHHEEQKSKWLIAVHGETWRREQPGTGSKQIPLIPEIPPRVELTQVTS